MTGYLRTAGSVEDTGELERTMLALRAAGASVRRFRGRDLVAALIARRRRDGSWRRNVAFTAFGILALRAAGEPPAAVRDSARWLLGSQNDDGGWGFVARAESDVDDTGAVLQALSAAGMGSSRAVDYLRRLQNGDGGFGQMEGRDSNAQSTAWAVQGLVAAGVRPQSVGSDPIRYLMRLQRSDGHIAYSRTSDQTPVWVTAQALTALREKPFPLAAVPREDRSRAASAAGPGGGRDVAGGGGRRVGSAGKPKKQKAGGGRRAMLGPPGPTPARWSRPAPSRRSSATRRPAKSRSARATAIPQCPLSRWPAPRPRPWCLRCCCAGGCDPAARARAPLRSAGNLRPATPWGRGGRACLRARPPLRGDPGDIEVSRAHRLSASPSRTSSPRWRPVACSASSGPPVTRRAWSAVYFGAPAGRFK